MKKNLGYTALILAGVVFTALSFRFTPVSGQEKSAGVNKELPDSVAKVISKSCLDCHGADGGGMAKAKMNFAKWNTYDDKKQASKAYDIAKEVSKNKMPPEKWRKNNPDDVPTSADAAILSNWANALNKK